MSKPWLKQLFEYFRLNHRVGFAEPGNTWLIPGSAIHAVYRYQKKTAERRLRNPRERDILVFNTIQGSISISDPRGDQGILVGDTLLCFGKQLALKILKPPPKK